MKAKYNHWYKCQEGQMPEDFDNCFPFGWNCEDDDIIYTRQVVVSNRIELSAAKRQKYCNFRLWDWDNDCSITPIAWMLPEPYKE